MVALDRALTTALLVLAIGAVIALMSGTVGDVGLRLIQGRGIAGIVEFSEILLVFAAAFGFAYAQRTGGHVSTALLTSRLPAGLSRALRILGMASVAVIVGWMLYATARGGWESMIAGEYRYGLRRVPIWPARLAIPIGLFALLIRVLLDIVVLIRYRTRDDNGGTGQQL